jgi:hypothetical protein
MLWPFISTLAQECFLFFKERTIMKPVLRVVAQAGDKPARGTKESRPGGQRNSETLGTAACYCGVDGQQAWTCITCLRFTRIFHQVQQRRAVGARP